MRELIWLPEPKLLFRYNQALEDPRDGLTLFGPLDEGKPYGICAGVVGTRNGIQLFKNWVERIQGLILDNPPQVARPPFPGFETVFRIPWKPQPLLEIEIPNSEIDKNLYLDDKYQRVYKTVEIYANRIIESIKQEESKVDIWFVIVSDDIYKYCRPKSNVEPALRIVTESKMSRKIARKYRILPSIFPEYNIIAKSYYYDVNFHNQLKARLLEHNVVTQVIRESTIAPPNYMFPTFVKRDLSRLQSTIAWNISTTAFYKAGGRPWKLAGIRDGVCYIGIVFKKDDKDSNPRTACCAAQMFLDSGDGVVFKGAVGPWYNPDKGEFHLKKRDATELVKLAIDSYKKKRRSPPKELFLHGKVRFNDEEWEGFKEAIDPNTNLVGVRIKDEKYLRLFKQGNHPILRGLALIRDEKTAYLWTRGFIPRLQTYPGREVPRPLFVDVCRGEVNLETVLNDIMALTKLNYNSCIFADGYPVTLRFADVIGEILTAGPMEKIPPLPFKFYI